VWGTEAVVGWADTQGQRTGESIVGPCLSGVGLEGLVTGFAVVRRWRSGVLWVSLVSLGVARAGSFWMISGSPVFWTSLQASALLGEVPSWAAPLWPCCSLPLTGPWSLGDLPLRICNGTCNAPLPGEAPHSQVPGTGTGHGSAHPREGVSGSWTPAEALRWNLFPGLTWV
jgi:hypothetical protein